MGVIERGRPAEKLRRDTRSPACGIGSADAGKHACSEESEPEKCETNDDDDDSIRPAVGTAAQEFASDRVPGEQHYQPNGHEENPDRDRRDKLQHRSGSSRAEASILSLRQIPPGRESLGFGRSPSQEPPEQPCRGACQCHKNPRHDKPGRNVSEGRFGPCVLHDPAPKEHAKKREESPGDDKHGRPPPPRGGSIDPRPPPPPPPPPRP